MKIEIELGLEFLKLSNEEKMNSIDAVLNSDNCKGLNCIKCPFYCWYGSHTPSELNCRRSFLWKDIIDEKPYAIHTLEYMKREKAFNFAKNLMIAHHYLEITEEQLNSLEYKVLEEYFWPSIVVEAINHMTNFVFHNEFSLEEIVNKSPEIEIREYYEDKLVSICFNGKVVAVNNTRDTYVIDEVLEKEFINFVFLKMMELASCEDKYVKTEFRTIQVIDFLSSDKGVAVIDNKITEVGRNG